MTRRREYLRTRGFRRRFPFATVAVWATITAVFAVTMALTALVMEVI